MNSTTLTPDYQEQSAAAHTPEPLIIERFLRDRASIWRQIHQEYRLNSLIVQMLTSSAVAFGCYGVVIGIYQSLLQAVSSAVKLPILFLLTLAICLPTLYLFNLFGGGRMSVRQVFALALSAITITSALTLAFVPITLFFMLTVQSYLFFVLLNTAILTLTGAAGLQFLMAGSRAINQMAAAEQAAPEAPAPAPKAPAVINTGLLRLWLLLYMFVGTQLGWTLRPFFGMPGEAFVLFRTIEGSFYTAVIKIILNLLLS